MAKNHSSGVQIGPGHFLIEIPIEAKKKLPPWEGKVLEQKQK